MKRIAINIAIWSMRAGGWLLILSLLWCLTTNYRGIAVRGQVLRLRFPAEEDDAIEWLIDCVKLRRRSGDKFEVKPGAQSAPKLRSTFVPTRSIPQLIRCSADSSFTAVTMAFDAKGNVLGAPVETGMPVELIPYAYYFEPTIIARIGDELLLILKGHAYGKWKDAVYRVYHLGFPESPLVLCLRVNTSPTSFLLRGPTIDQINGLVLQPLSYVSGDRIEEPGEIVVFRWNDELKQFELPPPAASGQWRASLDESVLAE